MTIIMCKFMPPQERIFLVLTRAGLRSSNRSQWQSQCLNRTREVRMARKRAIGVGHKSLPRLGLWLVRVKHAWLEPIHSLPISWPVFCLKCSALSFAKPFSQRWAWVYDLPLFFHVKKQFSRMLTIGYHRDVWQFRQCESLPAIFP